MVMSLLVPPNSALACPIYPVPVPVFWRVTRAPCAVPLGVFSIKPPVDKFVPEVIAPLNVPAPAVSAPVTARPVEENVVISTEGAAPKDAPTCTVNPPATDPELLNRQFLLVAVPESVSRAKSA